MEYAIKFKGHYEGQTYFLESNENEYRNLMSLLKDKICPVDFGQCGALNLLDKIKIGGGVNASGEAYITLIRIYKLSPTMRSSGR